ncbi:hypothetical protein KKC32_05285 [Patescibacteria group bacterium]|nr:hypothetical protein [Patescibacteria group bacterium]
MISIEKFWEECGRQGFNMLNPCLPHSSFEKIGLTIMNKSIEELLSDILEKRKSGLSAEQILKLYPENKENVLSALEIYELMEESKKTMEENEHLLREILGKSKIKQDHYLYRGESKGRTLKIL